MDRHTVTLSISADGPGTATRRGAWPSDDTAMPTPGSGVTTRRAIAACSRWLMNRNPSSTSSQRRSPASPHGSTRELGRSSPRPPFSG
jgi:hypothetical protein